MSSLPNSSSSTDLSTIVAASVEEVLPGGDLYEALHDVTCKVDVVLGSSTMTVRECLGLKRDSVLRLVESAGNDMQVVVNGIPIAEGEVVIIENSTAVRITNLLAPPSNEAVS
jgi:flagellar motor switch protein FliN/FliY